MGLFNRKKPEQKEEVIPAEQVVELGDDIVALGGYILEGERTGNFYVKETALVTTHAIITGNINARKAIIRGKVIGDIICSDEVILEETAVIEGKVMAQAGLIEDGCALNSTLLLSSQVKTTILPIRIAEAEQRIKARKVEQETKASSNSETSKPAPPQNQPKRPEQAIPRSRPQTQDNREQKDEQQDTTSWW